MLITCTVNQKGLIIEIYRKWEISGQNWTRTNDVEGIRSPVVFPLKLPARILNLVKGVGVEPTMLTFRSRFTVCRNTTVVAVPPEIWCERWDSNPHATRTSASKADTYRQFRHSRIVILFRLSISRRINSSHKLTHMKAV